VIVVLPSSVVRRIESYGTTWGLLDLREDSADGVFVVAAASKRQALKIPPNSEWLRHHYTSERPLRAKSAFWMTAEPGLAADGLNRLVRGGVLDLESELKPRLRGWQRPHHDLPYLIVTHATDGGGEWACWRVTGSAALFVPVVLVDEDEPLLTPLASSWPLADLERERVLLIGAGSIGAAAAEALASYAIRHLDIVDFDHLRPHNLARHRLNPSLVGRQKAAALRDRLLERDPSLDVVAHSLNVVLDADCIRDLMCEASIALVASDGVASRRTMNQIACWAGKPAVFACVLEDGAYGELLRVEPGRSGCLECDRDTLYEAGELDPEEGLDRGYLEGGGARPMSAVGGDLHLIGQSAAKLTIATLLERQGDRSQACPGDVMMIALRPVPDLASPFNFDRLLEVRWRDLPTRRDGCPACGDA
jgi:molybdopterin-synthase adenylyltransferase